MLPVLELTANEAGSCLKQGNANLAKSDRNASMTQLDDIDRVHTASIHLEWASIATSL